MCSYWSFSVALDLIRAVVSRVLSIMTSNPAQHDLINKMILDKELKTCEVTEVVEPVL